MSFKLKRSVSMIFALGIAIALPLAQNLFSSQPLAASALSYETFYRTVGELNRASTLIVVGQFQGSPTYYSGAYNVDGSTNDMSYSTMTFQASEILKRENTSQSASVIRIAQMSYIDGGELKPLRGERLFQAGEDYVLFLRPTSQPNGSYWVTGSVQGAFIIQGDRVSSINRLEGVISNAGPVVASQPLKDFLGRVRVSVLLSIRQSL